MALVVEQQQDEGLGQTELSGAGRREEPAAPGRLCTAAPIPTLRRPVSHDPLHAPDAPPRGFGPLALLLPIVALLAFALWRQARGGALPSAVGTAEVPESERGAVPVDGYAGAFAGPDGVLWTARLAPLHALPERQAFDAVALARRCGLPPGTPWRLTLERTSPAAASGDAAALGAVRAAGFVEFPAPDQGAPDAPVDPVRTLLAARPFTLPVGAPRAVFLWRPESTGPTAESVELTLLMQEESTSRAPLSIPLAATRLVEPRAGDSLARLPRAGEGASERRTQGEGMEGGR